ncbi:methylated-DNA--[protein]-cysteine S-methyltransferase [Sutcliffiella halmapala]|uniref:methylated-DNA--[protein]-cysteine S-methyltransferase n=1 Tax=Sutcliffiella halmapala TaxID=79882 RepID=UPI000995C03B|nr:methylated-DNA--[protein]-cysteine S-methyltransferase [Sutcliffiella halmapala]
MLSCKKIESLIGPLFILCREESLISIEFSEEALFNKFNGQEIVFDTNHPTCLMVAQQLNEYFNGERFEFSIPITLAGTPFQVDVWNALMKIPYGSVKSYKDIAEEINRPLAVRAIGQANKRNSFPIIIPCHRVIGKNNALVGYAGDKIGMKEQLLKLEGAIY